MIQDILPRHLDNQFRWMTPQKSDIILLFEGSSVLAKWQDEKIYYPDYEEFCTQTDAAKYTFIYVLSVDEIQYFLAMRKGEVLEGSFQGELSDAKVHEEYQSELDGYDFLGSRMLCPSGIQLAAPMTRSSSTVIIGQIISRSSTGT